MCSHRGGVARFLGHVWLPLGRGPSLGTRVAAMVAWPVFGPPVVAVGAWLVPWSPCVHRGSVVRPLGSCGSHEVVARPLGLVWSPWGRGPSPKPRVAAVGEWPVP